MGRMFTPKQRDVLRLAIKNLGLDRGTLTPEKLKVSITLTRYLSERVSLIQIFSVHQEASQIP